MDCTTSEAGSSTPAARHSLQVHKKDSRYSCRTGLLLRLIEGAEPRGCVLPLPAPHKGKSAQAALLCQTFLVNLTQHDGFPRCSSQTPDSYCKLSYSNCEERDGCQKQHRRTICQGITTMPAKDLGGGRLHWCLRNTSQTLAAHCDDA